MMITSGGHKKARAEGAGLKKELQNEDNNPRPSADLLLVRKDHEAHNGNNAGNHEHCIILRYTGLQAT